MIRFFLWDPIKAKAVYMGQRETSKMHQMRRKNPYLEGYQYVPANPPWSEDWKRLIQPGRGPDYWAPLPDNVIPKQIKLLMMVDE